MNIKSVLGGLAIFLEKDEFERLKKETKVILELLKREVIKQKIKAEVFVGGSFAKGTMVKKEEQDIDIFVRFDKRYEDLSTEAEKIVEKLCFELRLEYEKVHGSRDYFRIKREGIIFEVIPVLKVKNPKEAENVTDLSYFHVNYVKKKLAGTKIGKEIITAKQFCAAQGVYGAESYISGISGYGLECLMIYYKSFEKMARAVSKSKDKLVMDIERFYKNKNDIFISLNESKTLSPIILIDPTWKERNVLAALNEESFNKFKKSLGSFVNKPNSDFFVIKTADENEIKKEAEKKKAEFIHLIIETNRQEGDIAGTKMKKFSNFLVFELEKYYKILSRRFEYLEGKEANFYIILKSDKKEIVKQGPPKNLKKHARAFKSINKNVFEKGKFLYAKEEVPSPDEFIRNLAKSKKIDEMGITNLIIKRD